MGVNAALWKLVEGQEIPSSAQTVIEYAMTLPEGISSFGGEIGWENSEDSGRIQGHTEHGNVSLNENEKQRVTKEFGVKKDRIGHFRLYWRGDRMLFHHFWASGAGTAGTREFASEFVVVFDKKTKQALKFGVFEPKPIHIFWVSISFSICRWIWKRNS